MGVVAGDEVPGPHMQARFGQKQASGEGIGKPTRMSRFDRLTLVVRAMKGGPQVFAATDGAVLLNLLVLVAERAGTTAAGQAELGSHKKRQVIARQGEGGQLWQQQMARSTRGPLPFALVDHPPCWGCAERGGGGTSGMASQAPAWRKGSRRGVRRGDDSSGRRSLLPACMQRA